MPWVNADICKFCREAAHVYFCLLDPRYLADLKGFPKTEEARTSKRTSKSKSRSKEKA